MDTKIKRKTLNVIQGAHKIALNNIIKIIVCSKADERLLGAADGP